MSYVMKIVRVTCFIKIHYQYYWMWNKRRRGGFPEMLLNTLVASLLKTMLHRVSEKGVIRAGTRMLTAGQDIWFCPIL